MSSITPITEYLLAVRKPNGARVCRFSGTQVSMTLPAGFSITYDVEPQYGCYASIIYYTRFNPDTVPETIMMDIKHSGMVVLAGALTSLQIHEGINYWIELKKNDKLTTSWENVSGLNQWLDSMDFHLLVDSEEDLKFLRELMLSWGGISLTPSPFLKGGQK